MRFRHLFDALLDVSLKGLGYGAGSDVETSGEGLIVEHVKRHSGANPVIFDVGANVGTWTRMVIAAWEGSPPPIIHAFEPSPTAFAELSYEQRRIPNVTYHNFGLSSAEGTRPLYSDTSRSGLASLYRRRLDHFGIEMGEERQVAVKTLDGFCREASVSHIDLLKLDVEGHKLEVLKGAASMIAANAIAVIQWEFGGCNIDSRTFFQDFWYALCDRYDIYRVMQNGLALVPEYRESREVFITTNYVAILRNPQKGHFFT